MKTMKVLHRFVYSSRDSEVARAHVTFLPFSTGTHVIGVFV